MGLADFGAIGELGRRVASLTSYGVKEKKR